MTRRILSLIALLFWASCGENSVGTCGDQKVTWGLPEDWDLPYSSDCAAAKLTLTCAPPVPDKAVCPAILLQNLFWVMNEKQPFLLGELLSPDFTLFDEMSQTSIVGRTHELKRVSRVFDNYRGVEFNMLLSSRTITDYGCLVMRGVVQMRLYLEHDTGFTVNDQTILTACPQPEDGLWRLTEWRIVQSVSLGQPEEGFELVSWGEVSGKEE